MLKQYITWWGGTRVIFIYALIRIILKHCLLVFKLRVRLSLGRPKLSSQILIMCSTASRRDNSLLALSCLQRGSYSQSFIFVFIFFRCL